MPKSRNTGKRGAAAKVAYERALELFRQSNGVEGEANCLAGLADFCFEEHIYVDAQNYYESAMKLYLDSQNRNGQAQCLLRIGDIALKRGEFESAADNFQGSQELYGQESNRIGEACCQESMADLALYLHKYEHALREYMRLRAVYQDMGYSFRGAKCAKGMADTEFALAVSLRNCQDHLGAAEHARLAQGFYIEVISEFRDLVEIEKQAEACRDLALIYAFLDEPENARRQLEIACDLYRLVSAEDACLNVEEMLKRTNGL